MSNNLEIRRENAMAAYANADARSRELLENLFGKGIFVKQDVKERVKTFEDACNELGNEHPFVKSYEMYVNTAGGEEADVIAYLKLRIIAAALNEGWEPQLAEEKSSYYPWFEFLTKSEINEMSDDEKGRVVVVGSAYYNSSTYIGIAYVHTSTVSSYSSGQSGSRLNFKTRELAEYAGRQFVELYADFICWLNFSRKA